jgi:hypothetical protein
MALPQVNVTVVDGALGSIQPSTANVEAKLGVCSKGTDSVAASRLLASTTGGDGVTYTAVAAGAAGNLINVTIAAPSGGSTSVVVAGTNITVNPKAGAINSDIVTAVQASAPASALVSVVATGASDVVVAASQAYLQGGVDGTNNTILSLTDPSQAVAALGYGPLTDAVVHRLQVAGGQVYAVPVHASVAGTATPVTHGGGGAGTVAVAGAPYDAYQVLVKCVAGGALGVGTFTYSLDGGVLSSPVLTIPAGGTYIIPNTGLTLTFTNSFTAGDTYNFTCTAPSFGTTDIQNAFAALLASPSTWGWAHVVGGSSSAAGAATLAAAVDTLMSAAFSAYRYCFAVVEAVDTDANLKTAFASFASKRVDVCIATATLVSGVTGLSLKRSSAYPYTARLGLIPISEDPGFVGRGSLPSVTAIQRDEAVTPGLDALNFTTLRTIIGQPGFFITRGHMFAAPGSDFGLVQNRRVMDVACSITRAALLPFLNSSLRVLPATASPPGAIVPADAGRIEAQVNGQLKGALLAPGYVSDTSVVVDRNANILSTGQLPVTTRVTPLAYASDIEETIGFTNPALASQQTP